MEHYFPDLVEGPDGLPSIFIQVILFFFQVMSGICPRPILQTRPNP